MCRVQTPDISAQVKLKSGGSLTTASAVAFAEIAFEQNRISRGVLSGVKCFGGTVEASDSRVSIYIMAGRGFSL